MSVIDLLAVLSFGLACFCAGYTFGKDQKTQKISWYRVPSTFELLDMDYFLNDDDLDDDFGKEGSYIF